MARRAAPSGNAGRHAEPVTIRVIDYEIDDGRRNDETYRLFTTILDPDEVPAADLAVAYAQRWEIENTFDELKTQSTRRPHRAALEVTGPLSCRRSGATCAATTRSAH